MIDYYAILEISPNALLEDIKYKYRKLAKKYHPDLNKDKNSESIFKTVNEAYNILSNPQKRYDYDKLYYSYNNHKNIHTIFSQPKKEIKKKLKKTFKKDEVIQMEINFYESIVGTEIPFEFKQKIECKVCTGYGGNFKPCPSCDGNGTIQSKSGFITTNILCTNCKGVGYTKIDSCNSCNGLGFKEEIIKLNCVIPSGVDNYTRLVMRGKANKINNIRGDLYIELNIINDSEFRRDGLDIYKTLKLNVLDILIEDEIVIDGINEQITVDMNDIKNKKKLVFKEKGIKSINKDKIGDFIVEVEIFYVDLSQKQKEIIKSWLYK